MAWKNNKIVFVFNYNIIFSISIKDVGKTNEKELLGRDSGRVLKIRGTESSGKSTHLHSTLVLGVLGIDCWDYTLYLLSLRLVATKEITDFKSTFFYHCFTYTSDRHRESSLLRVRLYDLASNAIIKSEILLSNNETPTSYFPVRCMFRRLELWG